MVHHFMKEILKWYTFYRRNLKMVSFLERNFQIVIDFIEKNI